MESEMDDEVDDKMDIKKDNLKCCKWTSNIRICKIWHESHNIYLGYYFMEIKIGHEWL